jgi:ATP-dependent RNA helicase DeaD
VLYEAPMRREELEAVRASGAQRIVVFASAREAGHLRGLLAGGKARPLQLGGTAKKAKEREERLRAELRTQLEAGVAARELLALEPLAAEFDALEIAAAALRLMERARQSKAVPGPATTASGAERTHVAFKRVFMTIGSMDGATTGDVVGAVLNEAGLTKQQVGKVEMRDQHTLVEVPADQVERVSAALDGKSIRGRRIAARPDMERAERESRGDVPPRGADRPRGDRPPPRGGGDRPRSFDRGDRPAPRGGGGFSRDRGAGPARGFDRDRPPRSFDRGERPGPRSGGFDRDRPPRGGGGGGGFSRDRGPGPARGFDRDRGERPGPRGGDRPGGDRPRGGAGGGGFRGRDEGPRNAFGPGPREAGGERVDFNERAERLKRSKREPRPRTDGWSPAEDGEA